MMLVAWWLNSALCVGFGWALSARIRERRELRRAGRIYRNVLAAIEPVAPAPARPPLQSVDWIDDRARITVAEPTSAVWS